MMLRLFRLFLLVWLSLPLSVFAQINNQIISSSSHGGKWIWQEKDGPSNTWMCFRNTFSLTEIQDTSVLTISADSKYWLWINNELVVFEGGLKRGPNSKDSYYDTVHITHYLHVGNNSIALLVWHFGRDGFSHNDSGKGGLFLEADLKESILKSDSTWKCVIHPAYEQPDASVTWNYRLPESNIVYNASNDTLGNWKAVDYDDSNWKFAIEKDEIPSYPWGQLWLRPIPQWSNSGLQSYDSVSITLPYTTQTKTTVLAYLPYNAHITPYLDIETDGEHPVKIITDANRETFGVRAQYITKSGRQQYESYGWMNGHQVEYTFPEGVTIYDLQYRETGYDSEFSGWFHSDDDFCNTLWKKSQRTLYVNMRDTYMDCPDRERALWWGDAIHEIGQTFYALDRKSDLLTKKCISNLMKWQKLNGELYSPIPAGNWSTELPAQMLASIGKYGLETYFQYSGDTASIVDAYPHVKEYMNKWKLGENGLVEHRSGGWSWYDWGKNQDDALMDNCWYYLALQFVTKMAVMSGQPNDTIQYNEHIESIETHFDDYFWTGQYYKSPSDTGAIDERGNSLAVLSGLADESKWLQIRTVLKSEMNAGPYMEKFVLEALFYMGYEADAIERMKHEERYGYMVRQKHISTLHERFDGIGTYNHGWSGGPLILLSQYVAGIAPLSPGFEQYRIFPQEGHVTSISTSVPSVKGDIELTILKDRNQYNLEVTSPAETTALIGIPKRPFSDKKVYVIRENATNIWTSDMKKGATNVDGIEYMGEQGRYYTFSIQPGQYHFSALLKDAQIADFHELIVFPNPSKGIVRLIHTLPIAHVDVYSSVGQLLMTEQYDTESVTLDISNFPDGVYQLQIIDTENQVFLEQIVKM